MTEINQEQSANQKNGETTNKSVLSDGLYSLDHRVINGFVLRAKVFESIKEERSPMLKPIIEVE